MSNKSIFKVDSLETEHHNDALSLNSRAPLVALSSSSYNVVTGVISEASGGRTERQAPPFWHMNLLLMQACGKTHLGYSPVARQ